MIKYCPRCGAATERNAAFAKIAALKLPQEQSPV